MSIEIQKYVDELKAEDKPNKSLLLNLVKFDWEVAEVFLRAYTTRIRQKAIEADLKTRGAKSGIVWKDRNHYKNIFKELIQERLARLYDLEDNFEPIKIKHTVFKNKAESTIKIKGKKAKKSKSKVAEKQVDLN
jgi:hypothetical protein